MSRYNAKGDVVTLSDLANRKGDGSKISMVTCYDAAFARIVNETSIDMVLVGDSLGNVMLGYDDTIPVKIDHMVHHAAAVSRVLTKPFLAVDMPFLSYQVSTEQALENAGRLVQEGGAQAVKLEGGEEICRQVEAITKAGIPVIGHVGLTPQSVHALGGYKVQGRKEEAAKRLRSDVKSLEQAGASMIVFELIPAQLAGELTKSLQIPTIGIGAGPDCDGQVLVLQDLLGFDRGFQPKFLKTYANLGEVVSGALETFNQEVKEGSFPTKENSF